MYVIFLAFSIDMVSPLHRITFYFRDFVPFFGVFLFLYSFSFFTLCHPTPFYMNSMYIPMTVQEEKLYWRRRGQTEKLIRFHNFSPPPPPPETLKCVKSIGLGNTTRAGKRS